MPLAPRLCLLPLILGGALLSAADGEPKDTPKASPSRTFGATIQADFPLRDLKDDLDRRTGFGAGLQWTQERANRHVSRTRIEFNVFPEGGPVGGTGTKTYAKDYLLSYDHLFPLGTGARRAYLVAGAGGVHWILEQSQGPIRSTVRTTKLAFTGGLGLQLSERVNLEARYQFSGIQKTFDANLVQLSLGWRF